ncbi:hypothetical protein L3Q82_024465, partial [Scortum barcoo]
MEAENMVHSDSMSPASLGICEKLFRRWELKTSLTEGSARRSQQTLTIRLGLPVRWRFNKWSQPDLCCKMSRSSDDMKPVSCTIKPPVYLQIGDVKSEAAHSGVCVVDVTLPFGKTVNVGVVLTAQHRAGRLAFAREHQDWQIRHWRPVLFTDESRFTLSTCDRRDRVWRRRGERSAACNILQHDQFGSGSVMVWGGISLGGRTALHVLARGSLTAIRYRDEILRPLVRPYAGKAVGPGFLLMQDNARPHVAGVCQQFLQDEGIDAMDWPARSPDLNPIEHIWDIMSRSIHQRHVAPQTVQELADALVQVWEEIPQETIRHLIRSMPRRCREVEEITFKNYYTAYVTVRLLRRGPGQEAPAKWSTALRDLPLMVNPHTEVGSQDYFSIHRTQMQVEPDHVVSVRLILRQPSSAWLTFSLEEIKIYPHMEPDPEKEVSDWLSDLTLDDQHPDLEGLPDPQTVSSSIQQMWALTEVMQTNQTTASIGRFDVSLKHKGISLACRSPDSEAA